MKVIVFANQPPEFYYKVKEFSQPKYRLSHDRWKVFQISSSVYQDNGNVHWLKPCKNPQNYKEFVEQYGKYYVSHNEIQNTHNLIASNNS